MQWKQTTLSHTTTLAIHRIVRLPGATKEDFLRTLREEVLPMSSLPGLNRATNVVRQELLMEDTPGEVDTCLWAIYFNGVHRPDLVQEKGEAMYEGVRERVESVGVRTSLRVVTLQGRWEVET